MLAELSAEEMWTLAGDRQTVKLHFPPLRIAGFPEQLRVHIDFEAEMVDEILARLALLRSQMLPAPTRN